MDSNRRPQFNDPSTASCNRSAEVSILQLCIETQAFVKPKVVDRRSTERHVAAIWATVLDHPAGVLCFVPLEALQGVLECESRPLDPVRNHIPCNARDCRIVSEH